MLFLSFLKKALSLFKRRPPLAGSPCNAFICYLISVRYRWSTFRLASSALWRMPCAWQKSRNSSNSITASTQACGIHLSTIQCDGLANLVWCASTCLASSVESVNIAQNRLNLVPLITNTFDSSPWFVADSAKLRIRPGESETEIKGVGDQSPKVWCWMTFSLLGVVLSTPSSLQPEQSS